MSETRYHYGGDEYLLVIFSEAMDLAINFKLLSICHEIKHRQVPGVIEACPANASYLVHFRPEEIHPDQLIRTLKDIENEIQHANTLQSRLVDIPVLFDDPWTKECAQRFADRHQDPSVSNLEYLMRVNGYSSKQEFISAYCDRPFWISMVGFVPGTAWCYRMCPPDQAIQAPKYIRPRTDTPERAVAHGGVFLCIYPVRGPGGYQMIGMSAVPVYDPEEHLPDLRGRYILATAGDRWKFRPVDMDEYNDIRSQVEAGSYRYRIVEQDFRPSEYIRDPSSYLKRLQEEAVGCRSHLMQKPSMLNVIDPGLLTTVQDLGRLHWYHIGMPPAGALDNFAFRIGNLLVGNPEGAAGLEMTYTGPQLELTTATLIAVTGAEVTLQINNQPATLWRAHHVVPGDRISLGSVRRGARAYICIAGGVDVPERLGSRSTYMLGRFGGLDGRKLEANDQLQLGSPAVSFEKMLGRTFDPGLIPTPSKEITVRVVVGMCSHRVTAASLQEFLNATWEVSTEADRIGYRLKGPTFEFKSGEQPFGAGADPSNVVDLGYPIGSIQIPGGLEAIVLLNDAVTGGGYTTIGTVIKSDLDRIAQASPGCQIHFDEVGIEQALQARRDREATLNLIRMELGIFDQAGALGQ